MDEVEHLRSASLRAERLAKDVLDSPTIKRLKDAARFYRHQADQLELMLPR